MKKILSMLLICAICFALAPTVRTIAEASGKWEYKVNGTKATITGCSSISEYLIIPEVIDGYTVTEIGSDAFENETTLVKVDMPSSLRIINDCAFQNCENLEEVKLNKGLEKIGSYAFDSCNLGSITFPESLTLIEYNAFANNRNLTEITVKSEILQCNTDAFLRAGRNTTGGVVVTYNSSVKKVNGMFRMLTAGDYAKVTKINIEKGVGELVTFEVSDCIDLKDVYVYEDNLKYPTYYEWNRFYGDPANVTIHCNKDSTTWKYAKTAGYTVKELSSPGAPAQPVLYANGDMNGDGKLNTADAVIILKIAAGIIPMP